MSNRIFREEENELVHGEDKRHASADSFPFPTFSTASDSSAYDLAAKAASVEKEGFRPFDGNPLRSVEEEARAKAAIIVANAEANARKAAEEAYQEGYARGVEEGREAGREDLLHASSALRKGLEELDRLRDVIQRENEQHLVAVVAAAAERVIHREVQSDPSVVRDVVRAALRAAAELDDATIALHPDDLGLVQEEAEDLVAAFDHLRSLHLVAEPGIDRGGCVVHTPCGDIEARIPMQFEALVEALRSALPKDPGCG